MNTNLIHLWLGFAHLAAGVLILTAGAVQCALAHPFRKDRNPALATLGVAGVLYGIRLLASHSEIRALIPASPQFWANVDPSITYVMLIPILYYLELTFGTGWRESIRWLRIAATAFGAGAIISDAVRGTPGGAKVLNSCLVLVALIVVAANLSRMRKAPYRGVAIVRIALVILAGFVLFENVVNGPLLRGVWNVEWAGVLILLGCLGYVAFSTAVDNDRRLHELRHELDTARQIQASILPQAMPSIGGVSVAARYLPMTAVAGDFFDVLDLGSGRAGVLVADVSGHGVPAALIASMVKVALVAQSPHAHDPALVLAGMNEIFCGRLSRQFVTAAYAYIDATVGRLRYGAAGHPPALLVGRDGQVDEIVENGVMLGHFPGWPYTSLERAFHPGERLILYTDGLVEATNGRGDFFEAERLKAFANGHRTGDADAFAGALVEHIGSWSGRTSEHGFDDDLTIVVVDRLPGVDGH